jgi:hypothetical protein
MLQATLEAEAVASTNQEHLAAYYHAPTRLAVKPRRDAGYRLVLGRSQAFSKLEETLAEQFIAQLAAVVAVGALPPDPASDPA